MIFSAQHFIGSAYTYQSLQWVILLLLGCIFSFYIKKCLLFLTCGIYFQMIGDYWVYIPSQLQDFPCLVFFPLIFIFIYFCVSWRAVFLTVEKNYKDFSLLLWSLFIWGLILYFGHNFFSIFLTLSSYQRWQ